MVFLSKNEWYLAIWNPLDYPIEPNTWLLTNSAVVATHFNDTLLYIIIGYGNLLVRKEHQTQSEIKTKEDILIKKFSQVSFYITKINRSFLEFNLKKQKTTEVLCRAR